MTLLQAACLFAVLNMCDAISTYFAIKCGAVEKNPLQKLILVIGWPAFFIGKLGISFLFIDLHERLELHSLYVLSIVYFFIVWDNIMVYYNETHPATTSDSSNTNS